MADRKPYEPPRLTYLGTERPELWPSELDPLQYGEDTRTDEEVLDAIDRSILELPDGDGT